MRSIRGRIGTVLVSVATVATAWAFATPAHAAGAMCHGKAATIVGTSGNDQIKGTAGRDVIQAKGGNDQIWGFGGNDLICGGRGAVRSWAVPARTRSTVARASTRSAEDQVATASGALVGRINSAANRAMTGCSVVMGSTRATAVPALTYVRASSSE